MNDVPINILTAVGGGILGFSLKWFLAERKERYELRRSIAPLRAEAYKSLWVLCKSDMKTDERLTALWDWYNSGGGLYLSLPASERFHSAVKLMNTDKLSDQDSIAVKDHLTWLRTEMKYHVGSYTRREKKTQIADAK